MSSITLNKTCNLVNWIGSGMYMYMLVVLFLHGFLTDSSNGCATGTFSFNNECRQCPGNCSSCDSETACNSCKIGYHGEICSLACPQHCHDNECEKTSGTCLSCMKGYYSSENKTCIKCPESCVTCRSNSSCFACKSGYRGEFCEIPCSISNCKEGTSCDKNTGYCLDSCLDGLSGDLCDTKCDNKCKSCVRRNNNECTACAFDKHGNNCNKNCSSTCVKNECNDSDGVCANGCLAGYWGPMCEYVCSANCKNSVCMIPDGICLEGCMEGYYEHNCSKAHDSTQARHLVLVVGIVIGVVLAIISVAVCIRYFKRRNLSRKCKRLNVVDECLCLCCRQFHKDQNYKGKPKDEEMEFVAKPLHSSSDPTSAVNSLDKNESESLLPARKFRNENDSTPCNNPNEGYQSSNGEKYNTNANDETNTPDEPQTVNEDVCFINVASNKKSSQYIVSYGSKIAFNNESFWMKIWESQCEIVVMLSTSQESGEFNNSFAFGSNQCTTTVKFSAGRDWANYTMIPFTIDQDTSETFKEISVVLFEFFADIQENAESFLEFHKMVNGVNKKLNCPTLVHCSAGVHRCVTYLAVDMLQRNARTISKTDIRLCLQHLNTHSLETNEEQIEYISKILT